MLIGDATWMSACCGPAVAAGRLVARGTGNRERTGRVVTRTKGGRGVCAEPVTLPDPSPFGAGETRESHVHLDPVPASVAIARSFVREALPDVPPELLDVVILLTSELVTNAILHARTPVV